MSIARMHRMDNVSAGSRGLHITHLNDVLDFAKTNLLPYGH
jgi:hypothetical protein